MKSSKQLLLFFSFCIQIMFSSLAMDILTDEDISGATRFNPCINSIASRTCVIDSKVSEIDEEISSCCQSLESQLDIIDSKISTIGFTDISSCCDRLSNELESCCASLESHLSVIESKIGEPSVSCGIREISTPNYVITEPGHYCVSQELISLTEEPVITISSSYVYLDLNGQTLVAGLGTPPYTTCDGDGILIDPTITRTGITIVNGFITAPETPVLANNVGISNRDCDGNSNTIYDVTITDVGINNFYAGIFLGLGKQLTLLNISSTARFAPIALSGCQSFNIENCKTTGDNRCDTLFGNVFAGITVFESIEGIIRNCTADNNCAGITLIESTNIAITDCLVSTNSIGYFMVASSDVTLTNCFASTSHIGIGILGGGNITLTDCTSDNNSYASIGLQQVNNVSIEHCFASTSSLGISITDSTSISVQDSFASANTVGIGALNSSAIVIKNCSATENTFTGIGFETCSDVYVENCVSLLNETGFDLIATTSICFDHCTAKRNISDGFQFNDGSSGLVKDSLALANGGYGFNEIAGTSAFQYYRNNACDNAIANYSPIIASQNHAPVTSPANARGVDNVDCKRSDVDQIDILQSCCERLESCCEQTQALVFDCCNVIVRDLIDIDNHIESCCDGIESKIDAAAACEGTRITAAPYIITTPGRYQVCKNLSGAGPLITIRASDVTLELNGYELAATSGDGILVDSDTTHSGIVIENGFLVGNNAGSTQGINIKTLAHDSVKILNLDVRKFDAGINADNAQNLEIIDSNCELNLTVGILLGGNDAGLPKNVLINNCTANVNGNYGIQLNISDNTTALGIKIINCIANTNARGIATSAGKNIYIDNCSMDQNTLHGIEVTGGTVNLYVANTSSVNNSNTGFYFDNSGGVGGTGIFKECVSMDNGSFGFNIEAATSAIAYLANAAQSNGTSPAVNPDTNYAVTGVGTTIGAGQYSQQTPTTATSYWRNITLP